jgi:phage baseplate assembly protein W
MSNKTGKELEGLDHLKQSIIDILTTPIGSRIMRRDYGYNLFILVDKAMNMDFTLEIYEATAEELEKWEKEVQTRKGKNYRGKRRESNTWSGRVLLTNG